LDVDSVLLRETQNCLRAIEALEAVSPAVESRDKDGDEEGDATKGDKELEYCGENGSQHEDSVMGDEEFEKLKNEMKNAQASLHTIAEDNIAFKSDHPKSDDKLKDRIEGYERLARRFKELIHEFEVLHSNQLAILKDSLAAMTLGYPDVVDSKEDTLEISNNGKKTMEDFLREVELKEGAEKAMVMSACIEEKNKLQARIYFMKHLFSDMNTILTIQGSLINDTKADEDRANAVGWMCGKVHPGVVLSGMFFFAIVLGFCVTGLLMRFTPQLFGSSETTSKVILVGAGDI